MKKKFLSLIIAMATMLMCIFGLSACGKVEFKVNFVVDGAVYSTLNTNGEEIIKMPENPTKEDYTFDGWYWDKDTWQTPFTANSLLDAPLSSDMNVYCKWKANTVNVESVNLDKTELSLHEGDVEYLTATILPTNATDTSVVWESSNTTIATVVDGKVTALRVGSATITATTSDGGKIAACNVYVEPITVESVSLNHTALSLLRGESKTLTATVSPSNATEQGVLWHSANSSIVMVENGTVKAVGYGTATITATTIDGNKTATCEIEVIQDKITFNTLTVDGENVCGEVSNATTTFSFIREITEHGNATYQVYKEITCETLIASKSIALSVGDNTVYVLQTVGKDLKLYTVTVRRRPMYDVIFNVNGGAAVEKQVIEEGYLATEPITTRTGYTLKAWDYDFTQPITKNTEITAIWTANTNTAYKVEYYLQNIENDEYTLQETVNKTGTTDTTAKAEIKTFAHFTYKASATDSGNIAPNGSTVLKVYYTRNVYTISVNNTSYGSITNEGKYKYGKKLTSTASVKLLGYDFVGWYSGEELLSTDATYTFTVDKNVTANFAVKAEMSNFNFTSTATACSITGLKDKTVTEIVVPDYVTRINSSAFSDCSVLTKMTIPFVGATKGGTGNTHFGYIFGASSYSYNKDYVPKSLKKVTILDSVTSIGEDAFYFCDSLTSVVIGDSVTRIGEDAFYFCDSLTSVVIGDSVTRIGEDAFSGCSSLTTVKYMGDIAGWCNISFRGSSANPLHYAKNLYLNNELVTELVIPNTITEIKAYAFYNCSSLTSVEIPDGVTSIGAYAFYNCRSLTSITIPDSVTSIGSSAFYNCSSLTSVKIPDSVTSIGSSAFENCSSLTSVEIPNSVTSIGYEAFYNCSSLTSVEIPDSVTSIGSSAFENCSSLTSVEIPDSVTSIGSSAFENCSSLTSVVIGDGITSIGEDAFYHCDKLVEVVNKSTSITVTKGVTANGYVGYYALAVYNSDDTFESKLTNDNGYNIYTDGNEKILVGYTGQETDLTLPTYITKIYNYAFYNCSSLTSVKIGDGVTSIGGRAFYNCSSLTSITIPDSVTSIGAYAFYYCRSLTSVVIGDGITSIGAYAFRYCDSLTSVVIPDSVTSIDDYAFYNCSSLTSVVIGDSVTSIGEWAFSGCSSLTSVYYKGTASDWSKISIGSYNGGLTSATCYYYSKTEPTTTGNYWHYDENGNIAVW